MHEDAQHTSRLSFGHHYFRPFSCVESLFTTVETSYFSECITGILRLHDTRINWAHRYCEPKRQPNDVSDVSVWNGIWGQPEIFYQLPSVHMSSIAFLKAYLSVHWKEVVLVNNKFNTFSILHYEVIVKWALAIGKR